MASLKTNVSFLSPWASEKWCLLAARPTAEPTKIPISFISREPNNAFWLASGEHAAPASNKYNLLSVRRAIFFKSFQIVIFYCKKILIYHKLFDSFLFSFFLFFILRQKISLTIEINST